MLDGSAEWTPEDTAREATWFGGRSRSIVEVEGGSPRPVEQVLELTVTRDLKPESGYQSRRSYLYQPIRERHLPRYGCLGA